MILGNWNTVDNKLPKKQEIGDYFELKWDNFDRCIVRVENVNDIKILLIVKLLGIMPRDIYPSYFRLLNKDFGTPDFRWREVSTKELMAYL